MVKYSSVHLRNPHYLPRYNLNSFSVNRFQWLKHDINPETADIPPAPFHSFPIANGKF